MSYRWQTNPHTTHRPPTYYMNNRLYPNAPTQNEAGARTGRRLHEGLTIDRNYGIDTVSDDVNSSPYSSPYYINGRYVSQNLTTQTGNSASVQGTRRLLTLEDDEAAYPEPAVFSSMKLWQGKQIKFELPYTNKIVGCIINLRNTGASQGILSIYLSATENSEPIAEAAIDLCTVSQDDFETHKLYFMTPVPWNANPHGKVYIRMEVWDEVECKRSTNPYNPGRYIEVQSTGDYGHKEWVYTLTNKNKPVNEEPNYVGKPSCPTLGFIYNSWTSVPTNRIQGVDYGATVSKDGYLYDIFCVKNDNQAKVVVYDRQTNTVVQGTNIPVDPRLEGLNLVQAAGDVYYVDGYSELQRFTVGEWQATSYAQASGTPTASIDLAKFAASNLGRNSGLYQFVYRTPKWYYKDEAVLLDTYGITLGDEGVETEGDVLRVLYSKPGALESGSATVDYMQNSPVIGASIISFHCNRIWLSGFRYDPNLVQYSDITEEGPLYDSFVWRFYVPDQSPLATSDNPIVAMVEYEPDRMMIANKNSFSLWSTSADPATELPTQVSIHSDGAGVDSAGDITTYRGIIYSFDPDEGIRRFTGSMWNKIPAAIDTHIERVDMSKPRKLWGYAYKLYFNYTDSVDGKAKCLIWDMSMNYQQFPWFQDVDIPFCDVRYDNDYNLIGIHPDFPCIMKLYEYDTWRRLDTPIEFRRDTKFLSIPGNADDMILKRVFAKVIANSSRWWYIGLSFDKDNLYPDRGTHAYWRQPTWPTTQIVQDAENPFAHEDIYEQYATSLLTIVGLHSRAMSTQVRIATKTFRAQANLISVTLEAQTRPRI